MVKLRYLIYDRLSHFLRILLLFLDLFFFFSLMTG